MWEDWRFWQWFNHFNGDGNEKERIFFFGLEFVASMSFKLIGQIDTLLPLFVAKFSIIIEYIQ